MLVFNFLRMKIHQSFWSLHKSSTLVMHEMVHVRTPLYYCQQCNDISLFVTNYQELHIKPKQNFKQTILEPNKKMANTVAEFVFIPAPGVGVGHIMSTIEIAKLLVNRDQNLSVTILVIKPTSSGSGSAIDTCIESLAKNTINRTSLVELPQDETPPMGDSKDQLTFFNEFINSHCKYVRNIVAEKKSQQGSSRVSGFVIDMFCISMIDVANEFN